jgi:predicted oxidoreductase
MNIPQEITIAGQSEHPLHIKRLGYGTMRLTGEGIYGEPHNRPEALNIVREAIKSGIRFLDTADYYGEDVTNRIIAEALYPYPEDLVICTKVGGARKPDKSWITYNSPENLRSSLENNLDTLKLERMTLVQAKLSGKDDGLSKIELAKEILEHVTKNLKVGVKWVCFDAFYGRDTQLLADLIKQGLPFIADVPDNLHLWLEPFQMRVPKNKVGGQGRKYSYPQPNKPSIDDTGCNSFLKMCFTFCEEEH